MEWQGDRQGFIDWYLDDRNSDGNELRRALQSVPTDEWPAIHDTLWEVLGEKVEAARPPTQLRTEQGIEHVDAPLGTSPDFELYGYKRALVQEELERRDPSARDR